MFIEGFSKKCKVITAGNAKRERERERGQIIQLPFVLIKL